MRAEREPLSLRWLRFTYAAEDGTWWKLAIKWAICAVIVALLAVFMAWGVWYVATGQRYKP